MRLRHTLGTDGRRAYSGDESVQHQRAAAIPGVLWAAAAPQPALAVQLSVVVQRLDLLSGQVKPVPFLRSLHMHKTRQV